MKRFTTLGWAISLCFGGGLVACRDLAGTQPLPPGTVNPGSVQTATGAFQMAMAARVVFQQAFASFISLSGVLTDELQAAARGSTTGYEQGPIVLDARYLDQTTLWTASNNNVYDFSYSSLQNARTFTAQAIGALNAYAPTTSAHTRGEMYALQGYAEVMLADLFCSGIPLSTLTFNGDFVYQPGSTTTQVYQHAIALFDTALSLASDSAPIKYLAQVGQGRAYLALGNYVAAGQAVQGVPLTFQDVDSVLTCDDDELATCPDMTFPPSTLSFQGIVQAQFDFPSTASVSDREGGTGLPFISSGDPRTASNDNNDETTDRIYSNPVWLPNKYPANGTSALVLASGIEAQLIAAEAELNASNPAGAFTTLNVLRTSSPITAGMLPTLTDPGTFDAELDTLFTERAAWLFVDGHRQGDLRRLVRNYVNGQGVHVVANQYPSGLYPNYGQYGPFIDAPLPVTERVNPLFTGCLSRD